MLVPIKNSIMLFHFHPCIFLQFNWLKNWIQKVVYNVVDKRIFILRRVSIAQHVIYISHKALLLSNKDINVYKMCLNIETTVQ